MGEDINEGDERKLVSLFFRTLTDLCNAYDVLLYWQLLHYG